MDFGMPTLIEHKTLEDTLQLCAELGLDFVELNMNLPQYQIDALKNTENLSALSRQYKKYFTLHLDENLDFCNFNPYIAKAWQDTVFEVLPIAKALDIKILNMHMNGGVYFTLPNEKIFLYEKYFDEYIKAIKVFRDCCEEYLKNSDIHICIENTNGYTNFQKKAIHELLKGEHFALTWDIGHSHAINEQDMPFILEHKDRLLHMHIHDAMGKKDHMILGTGEINLDSRLKTARECGCRCVIETKTIEALKQSVSYIK